MPEIHVHAIPAETFEIDRTLERGREIYARRCSSCHGAEGQGVPGHYEEPLVGDLAVNALSDLVSETMPADDPDSCIADEAECVAKYVFEKFYSTRAQLKNNTPRIELSRRTVRQYRESIADLIGSFGEPLWIPDRRGLQANYFASSNWNEKRRLAKRIDPDLDFAKGVFHFRADGKYAGVEEIKKQNKMGDGFSVFWSGGIIAPESGEYEFIIHCRNGFKFWLNDTETPLIDRWVRSNDELTHTASIFLLAGRVYSLKLNLFQYQDPEVKIAVEWKTPAGFRTPISGGVFVPHTCSEGLAISTPFPPDDASAGYERGTSISRQWDESTTAAAIEAANWISNRIWKLAKTDEADEENVKRVREFCVSFVERAFVDRLSDEEIEFFVSRHFANGLSIYDQVKRVVILALKSPRFLYPAVQERDHSFEVATRLALVFWDSIPDQKLFDLASDGRLNEEGTRASELNRLLNDSRSRQKLMDFFHYWLKTRDVREATKDAERFPLFNEQVIRDLGTSLDMYLNEVVWSDSSDFRELFLADYLFANADIANFYGLDLDELDEANESQPRTDSTRNRFAKIDFDPAHRAGILTHPYLMVGLAYHQDSSPIHRGVFIARNLLGRRLGQPPDAVKPLTEQFDPKMTTRERVEYQTKDAACMNCHSVINPLGFSLENYDAVGRYRILEKRKPVDVSTIYTDLSGESIELTGARDLAIYLANNESAQKSFVRRLFRHYAKQSIQAYGVDCLDELHSSFVENNFSIKLLLVDIAKVIVNQGLDRSERP